MKKEICLLMIFDRQGNVSLFAFIFSLKDFGSFIQRFFERKSPAVQAGLIVCKEIDFFLKITFSDHIKDAFLFCGNGNEVSAEFFIIYI